LLSIMPHSVPSNFAGDYHYTRVPDTGKAAPFSLCSIFLPAGGGSLLPLDAAPGFHRARAMGCP
jgi:hypothetical protein